MGIWESGMALFMCVYNLRETISISQFCSITFLHVIFLYTLSIVYYTWPGLIHQNGKSSWSGQKRKTDFHPEPTMDQFQEHQEGQIWTSSGQQLPQNKHPFHNNLPALTVSPFNSSIPASQPPLPLHTLPVRRSPLSEQFLKSHSLQIIFPNMRTLANSPLPLSL